MIMPVINSLNNFRVLQWAKLKDKKHRDRHKVFIVEGYHLILEAYRANYLKELIITENKSDFDVTTYQVTKEVMKKISSLAKPTKLFGICYQKEEGSYQDNILLIDQIHHPGNLGTIIRNAVAFNVDTIVLNNSVDVYNQKVIQSTQGMIFHINIIKSENPLKSYIQELKKQNYQIIGTDVKEGLSVDKVKVGKKRALLVGNESEGVSDELLDLCDIKVNIKMNKKCESLNVGVATGIILFCLSGE